MEKKMETTVWGLGHDLALSTKSLDPNLACEPGNILPSLPGLFVARNGAISSSNPVRTRAYL